MPTRVYVSGVAYRIPDPRHARLTMAQYTNLRQTSLWRRGRASSCMRVQIEEQCPRRQPEKTSTEPQEVHWLSVRPRPRRGTPVRPAAAPLRTALAHSPRQRRPTHATSSSGSCPGAETAGPSSDESSQRSNGRRGLNSGRFRTFGKNGTARHLHPNRWHSSKTTPTVEERDNVARQRSHW